MKFITRALFLLLCFHFIRTEEVKAQTPTVPANNLAFTTIGLNSLSMTWTRGNGEYCLVVMRASPNAGVNPVNGNNYAASSTFGNGSNLGSSNYVVYESTGTSLTVTNLLSNTLYTVRIYEFNIDFVSFEWYLTSSYETGSHYTLTTAPSAPPTNLVSSTLTPSGATFNWTAGNGANHLLAVRQSTSYSGSPIDGTEYYASSCWSLGDALGSSPYPYVVKDGVGTSVTVTCLNAATDYSSAVFTYNGTGGSNNYWTIPAFEWFTTLALQPTVISTSLYPTDITNGEISVNWIKPTSGGGTYSLVTVKPGASNADLPVDMTLYTANSTYGLGSQINSGAYVVYNGTGNSVRVSGLSAASQYTVSIYEFNGGTGTYNNTSNYLTTSYLTGSSQTNGSEPTAAGTGLILTPSTNSITASWTNGNGLYRMVLAKPARHRTALRFDGTNDYVTVPYHANLQPTTAFTAECWVYRANWATPVAGMSAVSTLEGGGYAIYFNGTIVYGYAYRNSIYVYPSTDIAYLSPGWHHFAVTFDGRYTKMVVDGAEKAMDDAGAYYSQQYTLSNSLIIGAEAGVSTTPNGYYLDGAVDEVRIWSTAQSISTIRSNMRKGMVGNEVYLEGYWNLDDGYASTTLVKNRSNLGTSINGTLTNSSSTAASAFSSSSGWMWSATGVDEPVDFSAYTSNTSFTNGSIVGNRYYACYGNNGNSVTITNLTPGTYYNVSVFEYNTNTYYNYLTSSYLTGDVQTTAAPVPTIASFAPVNGPVGTVVTITGTNFSTTASSNIVYFGAEKANVLSSTATTITAVVPFTSNQYNPISVSVNSVMGYSRNPFNVSDACNGTIAAADFTGNATNTSTYSTTALTSGDLDKDGRADLVFLQMGAFEYLTIRRNTGGNNSVSFAGQQIYPTGNFSTGNTPVDVKLADIDGDGALDAIVLNNSTKVLSVWRNTSIVNSISLGNRLDFPLNASASTITTADFDGDGKTDVLVGHYSGSNVSVLRNTSSQGYISFADKVDFGGFTSPKHVAVCDVDGDGKTDITAANNTASSFACMRNISTVGNLQFSAAVSVVTTGNGASIEWADCDFDGKPDVLIAQMNNLIRVMRNTNVSGSITAVAFTNNTSFATLASTPNKAIFSDIDGDNRPDVVIGYVSSTNFSVFEQTGSFLMGTRQDKPGTGANTGYILSNDFGLDGKADVVTGCGSAFFEVFNNDMDPLASEPTVVSSGGTFSNLTQTSVQLTIGNPGNGSKKLYVCKLGSVSGLAPSDGMGYVPNPAYGSGDDVGGGNYVVANANISTVTVTNLQSNTNYDVAVFEYNDDGADCKANYLISPFYTGNFTTQNYVPVIAAINDPAALCQNAGLQTVNFSGVDDGDVSVVQNLTITATSNNQTLIPNGNISVSYTSPNPTGSVSFTPAIGQSGTATITVTVNDNANNNNIVTETFTVTVNAPPSTSTNGGNLQICTSSTTLTGNIPSVGIGTWSFVYTSNGSISIANLNLGTSAISNFNNGDSVRLAWTINNAPCTPSVSYYSIKRVTCPLDANFSANQVSFCGTIANVTFTDLSTCQLPNFITTWAWTFTGGSPNSFNGQNPPVIAYTAPGVYTVSLQVTDNTLATNMQTNVGYIVITPLPANPGAISGSTTVCAGQSSVNYSVPAIADATSYNWSVPLGATITSGQGTQNIVVDFSGTATTGNIVVYGSNSCGNGNNGFQLITVNPLPSNTGVITGPIAVCQGQTGVSFSVAPINNATGYNWTLPTGSTITAGNNTNAITVSFNTSAVSGTVNVVGTNSCGSGTSSNSYLMTVNPLPDLAGAITGTTTVCQNDTVAYSLAVLGNTDNYIWTVPTGASIIAGDSTNSILVYYSPTAVSGNVTVKGRNACGDGGLSTLAITINPLPVAATAIGGASPICAGDNSEIYFVSAITNATGYVWTTPPGVSIQSGNNTNVIVVTFAPTATSGNFTVYGTNACGNGASSSLNVIVSPLPDSAGVIAGNDTVCQAQLGVIYTVPVISNSTGYTWTIPNGATIVSGNNTNSVTVDYSSGAQSGWVTVTGTNACGSGLTVDSLYVLVDPLPGTAGTIVGDSSIQICPMQTGVVYSIPAVVDATGYNWAVPFGAAIVSGNNTNSITVDYSIGAQNGNITVTPTNACGTGTPSTHVIVIDTVLGLNICLVTVDSLSLYNQVAWDKPVTAQIDSFRIYREISSSFVHIGSVPYSAYSVYKDSIFLAPPANPNNTNYRYKISAIDACQNESEIGGHHRTIFLQANQGVGQTVNLNWITYEGATVNQYYIFRDSTGSGNLDLIDSVPGANMVYTDNNPSQNITTLRYVLGVDWGVTCNPSLRNAEPNVNPLAAINNTKSNLKSLFYDPSSISEWVLNNLFILAPNPNAGTVMINVGQKLSGAVLNVYDGLGRKMFSEKLADGFSAGTFDWSEFGNGVYDVTLEVENVRVHRKMVIQQ